MLTSDFKFLITIYNFKLRNLKTHLQSGFRCFTEEIHLLIQVPGINQRIYFKFQTKCYINSQNSFQTKCLIQSNYFLSNIGYTLKQNSI